MKTSTPPKTAAPTAPANGRPEPHPAGKCASCGQQVRGRFCSRCGATAEPVSCAVCDAPLAAGDHFCFECGTRAGAEPDALPASSRGRDRTGWIVAGIAFVGLLGLTAIQFAKERREQDAGVAAAPTAAQGGSTMPTASELSQMSPRQQIDRLFDRIMRLRDEGKKDSIAFFAPMVMGLYERLTPLDTDLRYDLGTVANAAGQHQVERAQADTILRAQPTHLLGLVMAARASTALGDAAAARGFLQRLLAAEPAERAKQLEEYERHKFDIDQAMTAARAAR